MFWRCACVKTVGHNLQQAKHECDAEAGTNAHSGALKESVALFGHGGNVKSDATFDLIILLGKLFM